MTPIKDKMVEDKFRWFGQKTYQLYSNESESNWKMKQIEEKDLKKNYFKKSQITKVNLHLIWDKAWCCFTSCTEENLLFAFENYLLSSKNQCMTINKFNLKNNCKSGMKGKKFIDTIVND